VDDSQIGDPSFAIHDCFNRYNTGNADTLGHRRIRWTEVSELFGLSDVSACQNGVVEGECLCPFDVENPFTGKIRYGALNRNRS